jgi:alcohol dehydrogenase, propanol-preferring
VTMMRAAVLDGPGRPLRITDLPRPVPGPGELLVRLEASGVCHTDVHIWQGHSVPAAAPDPFILGHKGVGRVAAIGPGVEGWQMEERVGVPWMHDTCGICELCVSGNESFCARQRAHGFDVPGTFAEYVVVKAAYAVRLPDGDALPLAPLLCAGLTAHGALDRGALQYGETCAVFGCGGLGLYAVQLAKRRGARVVAIDLDPAKQALARSMGADAAAASWPSVEAAHVTINFAPTPHTWPAMQTATRPLGRIVAAAMVSDPVPLSQEWLTWTGITLTGTSVGTRAQMAGLMAEHARQPLQAAIVEIGLEDVTVALGALADGKAAGRYCIRF